MMSSPICRVQNITELNENTPVNVPWTLNFGPPLSDIKESQNKG